MEYTKKKHALTQKENQMTNEHTPHKHTHTHTFWYTYQT